MKNKNTDNLKISTKKIYIKYIQNFEIVLFGIILFVSTISLQAQNTESTSRVGTTAAQFLKIGSGARSIALAGAYVAVDQGIESIFWNPANIARISGVGEASFNHSNWLAEINYDFAALSINTEFGTIGLQFTSLRVPEDEVRTIIYPEGTGQVWDASSIALGLTFARNLTDQFSIGFTGKYIQESILNETAKTFAVDLGIFYQTPWEPLKLGASITNFGGKMLLDGRDIYFNEAPVDEEGAVDAVPGQFRLESYDIPLVLRFGISWQAIKTEDIGLLFVADGTHPNDNDEYMNLGIETGFWNMVFLRAGYRTLFLKDSEQGLTFGLGIRYDAVGANFRFDFGYADYGRLESVQFFTLSIGY